MHRDEVPDLDRRAFLGALLSAGAGVAAILLSFSLALRADAEEPPPPAGAEAEGFVDSGGVKLHYVARGEGPLCVLLHGFPDFSWSWRRQLPELSRRFRAVAVDLRGYNLSDKPEGIESYAMEKLVADVLSVLEHFKAEKAVVAGHDWGGAIAWSFAMSHPERTERLVIFNLPHPKGLLRELAANPLQQLASAYARGFQEPDAAKSLTPEGLVGTLSLLTKLDEADRAKYLEAFRRSSMESLLAYYKANYPRPPYKDDREFPPVKCPVLMFHGLKDPALLPGALNDTWKWLEKDLTLITVPGAGHWVHLDATDLVNRSLMAWLSR
jgi:pimeloyl-ACP methyl ester carboxylesterase